MNGLQICCPSFEAAVVDEHIFCEEDGEVSVPGCCGGGCNILRDIKHWGIIYLTPSHKSAIF